MQPGRTLALLSLVAVALLAACTPAKQPSPTPTTAPPTTLTPTLTTTPAQPTLTPKPLPTITPTTATLPTADASLRTETLKLPVVAMPVGFKAVPDPSFARFQPRTVAEKTHITVEPIAPDLSNVALTVLLSPEQQARVAANGFVVSPGTTKEFYELYERARYDNLPIFVSSDSLLHVYHLLFDKTLRKAETTAFIPMLTRLDAALLQSSVAQYEALAKTPWAEPARRNAAYFALAVKVLDPTWEVPAGLRDLVEPDLASLTAHAGFGPSAIFPAYPQGEDWSQYVPRGHYTKSEELGRYFKAMIWHGRMTFRADDVIETRQAALLTLAYTQTKVDSLTAAEVWAGIYEPTVFFVGRSDDLTPRVYAEALTAAYGAPTTPNDLLDATKFAAFQTAVEALRPPQILGMVVTQPTATKATKGLRLMGQRFVPDAFVFQQLISDAVPERDLPSSLDFFAALGSTQALTHLAATGATALPNYSRNMTTLRETFAGYSTDIWTQNLYWSWIYSLRPLLTPTDANDPQFMRSLAWQDKQLTTGLASWTELKRDTILYAKQVYVEMGYGALKPPEPERPRGYVEPVPELYTRVAALTQMTIDGLTSRGLLAPEDRAALRDMAQLATLLRTLAEKELRGEALLPDEYEQIRLYGGTLEGLTFAADDESVYQGPGGVPTGGEDLQAAIVADVATDPGGQVLENAVGRVFEIYVVVPVEGRLLLAKGGVFSHYEFTQPLSDRLTDEAWRARLDAGNAPPLAPWTSSYLVEQSAAEPLATTIRRFNEKLVEAFWYTDAQSVAPFVGPSELADTQTYIAGLKAQGQFVGTKLLGLELRSFDFVDANNAVVTSRERWSDELYKGSPVFEEQQGTGEPQRIGVRAPYTLNVTYTLQREGETWRIMKVVMDPASPPPWTQP